MDAVCHKQLHFGSLFGKPITADFEGGRITSDAGGLLLRELDERHGLTEGVASTLRDCRHPSWIFHEPTPLVRRESLGSRLATDPLPV